MEHRNYHGLKRGPNGKLFLERPSSDEHERNDEHVALFKRVSKIDCRLSKEYVSAEGFWRMILQQESCSSKLRKLYFILASFSRSKLLLIWNFRNFSFSNCPTWFYQNKQSMICTIGETMSAFPSNTNSTLKVTSVWKICSKRLSTIRIIEDIQIKNLRFWPICVTNDGDLGSTFLPLKNDCRLRYLWPFKDSLLFKQIKR